MSLKAKARYDSEPFTVRRALGAGADALSESESARLEAELLLAEALRLDRRNLYLNPEMLLESQAEAKFRSLLARRRRGEPVAYITGRREFWSLDFTVTPAVLVPRPETEILVESAVSLLSEPPLNLPLGKGEKKRGSRRLRILDLGTGSGAVAVSLAQEISHAEIWATDISSDALDIARANARRYGFERRIHFFSGDLFEPVRDLQECFDAIVANPPYVRRADLDSLPRDVRDFEPRVALDGGADGLDFYRRIVPQAPRYLAAGGFLALEIGADLGDDVVRLFATAGGYAPSRRERDYAGRERVVSARLKGKASG
jgi:release factor glutamine methyltransferase